MTTLMPTKHRRKASVAATPILPLPANVQPYKRDWIDYRHSLAQAVDRPGAPLCEVCGCEMDRWPVPHSPRCSA